MLSGVKPGRGPHKAIRKTIHTKDETAYNTTEYRLCLEFYNHSEVEFETSKSKDPCQLIFNTGCGCIFSV